VESFLDSPILGNKAKARIPEEYHSVIFLSNSCSGQRKTPGIDGISTGLASSVINTGKAKSVAWIWLSLVIERMAWFCLKRRGR